MKTNKPAVAVINMESVKHLVRGLAYIKTLSEKSKVGENFDNSFYMPLVQEQQPSSLSVGENFSQLQLKRWVCEESNVLWRKFEEACKRSPADGHRWLEGAKKARENYFRNYQSQIDSLNRTNQKMASALRFSSRTGAIVQYGAEVALIGMSLLGGASYMTVNLALKKFAVGVTSGIAINVCESWSAAQNADLWVGATTVRDNTPGTLDDVFKDIMNALNGWSITKMTKVLQSTEAAYKANEQKLLNGKNLTEAEKAALRAEREALIHGHDAQLRGVNARTNAPPSMKVNVAGYALKGLNWGLSAKSLWDSSTKLYTRWNQ